MGHPGRYDDPIPAMLLKERGNVEQPPGIERDRGGADSYLVSELPPMVGSISFRKITRSVIDNLVLEDVGVGGGACGGDRAACGGDDWLIGEMDVFCGCCGGGRIGNRSNWRIGSTFGVEFSSQFFNISLFVSRMVVCKYGL